MATSSCCCFINRSANKVSTALEDKDHSQWMENLPNEKQQCPLIDLVMPGSHDSGTFSLDRGLEIGPGESRTIRMLGSIFGKVAKSVVQSWSVTQSMTVYEQLMSGIRYLDLRVAYRAKDNSIRVLHGLYGTTIDHVLEDVKKFVTHYPKEIVILDFNHFYNMDQKDREGKTAHEILAEKLLQKFERVNFPPPAGEDRPYVSLQKMWQKRESAIIFYPDVGITAKANFWPSKFISSPWPNTADITKLMKVLKKEDSDKDVFQVMQAILTPQTGMIIKHMCKSLKDVCAEKCNLNVTRWLKSLDSTKGHKFNIIIADFVELDDFIPTVINLNYFPVKPPPLQDIGGDWF